MMVANKISYQYPPNFSQRAYLFFSITYTFQYSIQVNSIRIKREEKRGRKGRRKGEGRTGEERRGEETRGEEKGGIRARLLSNKQTNKKDALLLYQD